MEKKAFAIFAAGSDGRARIVLCESRWMVTGPSGPAAGAASNLFKLAGGGGK
jgi:ATP-dependent protease ClpP protease subunit